MKSPFLPSNLISPDLKAQILSIQTEENKNSLKP